MIEDSDDMNLYYRISEALQGMKIRKNYKLALLFDDVLTSFASILTDLGTSSTVIPEDLELGGGSDPPPTTKDLELGGVDPPPRRRNVLPWSPPPQELCVSALMHKA